MCCYLYTTCFKFFFRKPEDRKPKKEKKPDPNEPKLVEA